MAVGPRKLAWQPLYLPHQYRLGYKLGAVNRTQAVATALRARLIGNGPPSGNAAV